MKNNFIMLVGIPGSGKSTYARHLQEEEGYVVHSSDAIREELVDRAGVPTSNSKVFNLLHQRVMKSLREGDSVVYDATNLSRKRRQGFLKNLNRLDCMKTCRVLALPLEACKERNLLRDEPVPDEVIERMANSFQIPVEGEGWDRIDIMVSQKKHSFNELFTQMLEMPHDSPHHQYSIGQHMLETYELADEDIKAAALLHDFGKFFTKEMKNKNGKGSKVARYYGHDNRGVYELLSRFYNQTIRHGSISVTVDQETLTLIQYHMYPFLHWTENHQVKWKELLGEDIFEKLVRLNEADRAAH